MRRVTPSPRPSLQSETSGALRHSWSPSPSPLRTRRHLGKGRGARGGKGGGEQVSDGARAASHEQCQRQWQQRSATGATERRGGKQASAGARTFVDGNLGGLAKIRLPHAHVRGRDVRRIDRCAHVVCRRPARASERGECPTRDVTGSAGTAGGAGSTSSTSGVRGGVQGRAGVLAGVHERAGVRTCVRARRGAWKRAGACKGVQGCMGALTQGRRATRRVATTRQDRLRTPRLRVVVLDAAHAPHPHGRHCNGVRRRAPTRRAGHAHARAWTEPAKSSRRSTCGWTRAPRRRSTARTRGRAPHGRTRTRRARARRNGTHTRVAHARDEVQPREAMPHAARLPAGRGRAARGLATRGASQRSARGCSTRAGRVRTHGTPLRTSPHAREESSPRPRLPHGTTARCSRWCPDHASPGNHRSRPPPGNSVPHDHDHPFSHARTCAARVTGVSTSPLRRRSTPSAFRSGVATAPGTIDSPPLPTARGDAVKSAVVASRLDAQLSSPQMSSTVPSFRRAHSCRRPAARTAARTRQTPAPPPPGASGLFRESWPAAVVAVVVAFGCRRRRLQARGLANAAGRRRTCGGCRSCGCVVESDGPVTFACRTFPGDVDFHPFVAREPPAIMPP